MITTQEHQFLGKDLAVKKKLEFKSTKYLQTQSISVHRIQKLFVMA